MTSLIPKGYDPSRRPAILSEAANWYGTTNSAGSLGSATTIVVTFNQPDDEPPTAGVLAKLVKSR